MGWVSRHWCLPRTWQVSITGADTYSKLALQCLCWHLFVLSPPGFQVVPGDNSGRSDPGTIISFITPRGPADVNGCLKPGRLLGLCSLFLLCGWDNRIVSILACVLFLIFHHRCRWSPPLGERRQPPGPLSCHCGGRLAEHCRWCYPGGVPAQREALQRWRKHPGHRLCQV